MTETHTVNVYNNNKKNTKPEHRDNILFGRLSIRSIHWSHCKNKIN